MRGKDHMTFEEVMAKKRTRKTKIVKKILSVKKMFVTLHSPKMGKVRLVYPFKLLLPRLVCMEANYPSAAKMYANRRRTYQQ